MSLSVPVLAVLYGLSVGVMALGLWTVLTGRMPSILRASSGPQTVRKIRLDGVGFSLLGLFMLLTAIASGQGEQTVRSLLMLAIWLSFTCAMLILRVLNRRLDQGTQAGRNAA